MKYYLLVVGIIATAAALAYEVYIINVIVNAFRVMMAG